MRKAAGCRALGNCFEGFRGWSGALLENSEGGGECRGGDYPRESCERSPRPSRARIRRARPWYHGGEAAMEPGAIPFDSYFFFSVRKKREYVGCIGHREAHPGPLLTVRHGLSGASEGPWLVSSARLSVDSLIFSSLDLSRGPVPARMRNCSYVGSLWMIESTVRTADSIRGMYTTHPISVGKTREPSY